MYAVRSSESSFNKPFEICVFLHPAFPTRSGECPTETFCLNNNWNETVSAFGTVKYEIGSEVLTLYSFLSKLKKKIERIIINYI